MARADDKLVTFKKELDSSGHCAADTKCWAYCPPGGLVSANLSAAMAPFCTSVIVGKDAISRVSMSNLAGMMDEVLIALARCKQPTCKV